MTRTSSFTDFPNLDLVGTVQFTRDIIVVYTNDSLHRVCFLTVYAITHWCMRQMHMGHVGKKLNSKTSDASQRQITTALHVCTLGVCCCTSVWVLGMLKN